LTLIVLTKSSPEDGAVNTET